MAVRDFVLPQGYIVIDVVHAKIHDGQHYTVNASDSDVDVAETLEIGIAVPAVAVAPGVTFHLVFLVSSALAGLVELFEGSTFTGGTPLTAYNNNRNSTNTTVLVHSLNPTVTVDGTCLFSEYLGTGSNPSSLGATSASRVEYMLKEEIKYVLRYTSNTINNIVHMDIFCYENK